MRTRETGRYHIVSCPVCGDKTIINTNRGGSVIKCSHVRKFFTPDMINPELPAGMNPIDFCIVDFIVPDGMESISDRLLTVEEMAALYDEGNNPR